MSSGDFWQYTRSKYVYVKMPTDVSEILLRFWLTLVVVWATFRRSVALGIRWLFAGFVIFWNITLYYLLIKILHIMLCCITIIECFTLTRKNNCNFSVKYSKFDSTLYALFTYFTSFRFWPMRPAWLENIISFWMHILRSITIVLDYSLSGRSCCGVDSNCCSFAAAGNAPKSNGAAPVVLWM